MRTRSYSIVFAGAALVLVTILQGSANAMTCSVSIDVVKGGEELDVQVTEIA